MFAAVEHSLDASCEWFPGDICHCSLSYFAFYGQSGVTLRNGNGESQME